MQSQDPGCSFVLLLPQELSHLCQGERQERVYLLLFDRVKFNAAVFIPCVVMPSFPTYFILLSLLMSNENLVVDRH